MKKAITKISFIAIMLCVVMLAANCKKDDTTTPNNNNPAQNTTNYATIDGVKIPFTNAVVLKIEDYFYQQNLMSEFVLCLTTSNVVYNNFLEEFNGYGSGAIIRFNSKNKTSFNATDYIANPSITEKGKFNLNIYQNFNFSNKLGFTGTYSANTGTGIVNLTNNIFEITLDCKTSDNKTLKVYYKGTLTQYIRDSELLK